jgi:hypothetical protein
LTPRERQVFELVIRGEKNKQIGFALGTTERTIKAHRQRVMEKMQVQSLAELVAFGDVLMVFDDGIDGGSYASYRASPSIDGIRQEHAGRDIPYGDRKT